MLERIRLNRIREILLALLILISMAGISSAAVFNLQTGVITKTMPDTLEVVTMWGFGLQGGPITVPGPLLVVPPGDNTLTINLQNNLAVPVSIVIPGQMTTMTPTFVGGRVMSFTNEAAAGGAATYTWTNLKSGTTLYQSGTHPAVQVQMGLYGAVKHDSALNQAYSSPASAYQNEVILFFSAIDPVIHGHVANGTYGTPPPTGITSTIDYDAKYFLINGQPYSAALTPIPAGNLGQTTIIRFLNAGLETYVPLLQGLYMKVIAEDGNLLPYPREQYSLFLPAGKTFDALINPTLSGNIPVYDRRLNLTNNTTSPGGLLTYLAIASNQQDILNLVVKYYNDILGRAPEPGGAEGWTAEIDRIVSLGIDIKEGFIAIGKVFFNSAEYLSMGKTDTAYVLDLYQAFLNRAPSQPEVDSWLAYLTQGVSRNEVLNFFIFSAEFNTYMAGLFGASTARPENNLVNDFYRGLLSRLPDTAGFNSWLNSMRAAQCAGAQQVRDLSYQIASLFVASAEYVARARTNSGYVEDLYDAILRRGAAPDEITYWLNILTGGTMTREQVLQAFTNSPEFQTRVTAVINAGCL